MADVDIMLLNVQTGQGYRAQSQPSVRSGQEIKACLQRQEVTLQFANRVHILPRYRQIPKVADLLSARFS